MYNERKRILFFGLPWTFTKYSISEERVCTKRGFLKTVEDDVFTYKISDVKLERSLPERIFGLGTVVCYSNDATDAKLVLCHIKHSSEIKEFILTSSESERQKRRTVNTMDLDVADASAE